LGEAKFFTQKHMSEEAHGSSSRIPRPLRSNTDKSGQTLQEVLLSTAEEKKRKKKTSTSRPDTEEEYSNQEDSDSVSSTTASRKYQG
jgi:hypothetical protein